MPLSISCAFSLPVAPTTIFSTPRSLHLPGHTSPAFLTAAGASAGRDVTAHTASISEAGDAARARRDDDHPPASPAAWPHLPSHPAFFGTAAHLPPSKLEKSKATRKRGLVGAREAEEPARCWLDADAQLPATATKHLPLPKALSTKRPKTNALWASPEGSGEGDATQSPLEPALADPGFARADHHPLTAVRSKI
jgi:hypothetical protein